MNQLFNFDLYAMTHPKSDGDVVALLREAHAELDQVNQLLDEAFAKCEMRNDEKLAA